MQAYSLYLHQCSLEIPLKEKKIHPWRHYVREAHGSHSSCPRTPKGQTTRAWHGRGWAPLLPCTNKAQAGAADLSHPNLMPPARCLPLPCPIPLLQRKHEGLFSQQSPGLIPRHIPRTHRPSRQNKGNFTQTSRKHRTRQLLSARLEHARYTPSQHVHRSQQGWATEKASSSRPSSFTCYRLEKMEHPFSVKLCSSFL